MVQSIFNFVINSIQQVNTFTTWLFQPLGNGINISPIGFFSIGGFSVILILHIIHLVNPLG